MKWIPLISPCRNIQKQKLSINKWLAQILIASKCKTLTLVNESTCSVPVNNQIKPCYSHGCPFKELVGSMLRKLR